MMERKADRNYGIDALRIVSMLMIVILHVMNSDGLLVSSFNSTVKYEILSFIKAITFCAVNCYALISGYVGLSARHKYSSLVLLWLRVVFYSFSISLVFKILYPSSFGLKRTLFSFFPIISNEYWYFTSYFILFLFIPLLNISINHINKKQIGVFFVILFFFTTIIYPIWNSFFCEDSFMLNDGYSPLWLMILYLLGAGLKKFEIFKSIPKKVWVLVFVFSVLSVWASKFIIRIVEETMNGKSEHYTMWQSYTSVFVLVSAVSLFALFERIKLSKILIRVVSFLSPMTFSVYLIHNNKLIKDYLFTELFSGMDAFPTPVLLLIIFSAAVMIYIVCSLIDLMRIYIFKLLRIKSFLEKIEAQFFC